jgi:hypothetical protein
LVLYGNRYGVLYRVSTSSFFIVFFRFVEEHRHEWGERIQGGGEVSPLEAAPRRWRLALANKNTGAFQGWKVLITTFLILYDQCWQNPDLVYTKIDI